MCSLSCMPMPWKPVSVAPTESVKIALGNAAIQRFFTGGLKIAALLEIANRLERVVRRAGGRLALVLLDQRAAPSRRRS